MSSAILELSDPEPSPRFPQPTPRAALVLHARGEPHYGCTRRLGRRVTKLDAAEPFAAPVVSWDCHFYFSSESNLNSTTLSALELRAEVLHAFPDLTVNRPYARPVGPHPIAMWSCELHSPAQFARFLPWLCTRRRGLSVLVHPNTGRPFDDHSDHCYWLGAALPLRLDIFQPRKGNGSG